MLTFEKHNDTALIVYRNGRMIGMIIPNGLGKAKTHKHAAAGEPVFNSFGDALSLKDMTTIILEWKKMHL